MLVAGLVVGFERYWAGLPDRVARADASAKVTFTAVRLDADSAAPLRIAGAWRLTSSEPRLGGVSAMAVDRGALMALTDSGVVIRLPRPGGGSRVALFRDLPAGPGLARYKSARDSEALARDASGDGWWVAFENRHSVWRYDADFVKAERRFRLRRMGWSPNEGAEGMLAAGSGLTLFPEEGRELVRIDKGGLKRIAIDNPFGRLADVTTLPDGRILLLARNYSPAGFSAKLVILEGAKLRQIAKLKLGRLDNPEAIAAEALPGGGTRVWIMTDNDFRQRVPTMLIALDWNGPGRPSG